MTDTPHRSIGNRLTRPLMPLLLFACLLAQSSTASAATYTVDSCQHPDGAYAGRDGWTASHSGVYVYTGDSCAGGGPLDAYWASDIEHNYSDLARWTFAAPTGTTIRSLSGTRSARAAAGRPYGTPVTVIKADDGFLEQCGSVFPCSAVDGEFVYGVNSATSVAFGVECGGAPGGRCPGGTTAISVRRLRITLADNFSPTFNGPPTGSLTSPASTTRVRTVNYSANDIGGGVYRQRLLADGREVAAGPVDGNEGRCVRYPVGNGFSSPVPCRTTVSGSMAYDTAGLSDGPHELELQVFDATDENKVVSSWSVQVDNAPPSVGAVSVDGIARDGEALRCSAAVEGQSPRVAYQWLRSNADGSDVKDIAGATEATYRLVSADVGKKLLCRLTGTDGGGSATRTSSLTSGPFAGGGLVGAKDSSTPATQPGTAPPATQTGSSAPPAGQAGTTPATSEAGPSASSVAPQSSAPAAQLPPLPACTGATVAMFGSVSPLKRSYRRSGFGLSGRLMATNGKSGVGGAALDVMQTVTRAGLSQRTKVGTVTTAPDGSFRAKVPPGPTRLVHLVEPTCGSVGPTVSQRVRGAVLGKTTTRRVRNRQTARFRGRVLGGYVGRGLPLELQVKVGSSWKDVKAVTTNPRGEYRVSYRFMRTYVRYTYRFRIVTRAGSAWPYMAAKSRQLKVRVN